MPVSGIVKVLVELEDREPEQVLDPEKDAPLTSKVMDPDNELNDTVTTLPGLTELPQLTASLSTSSVISLEDITADDPIIEVPTERDLLHGSLDG